MLFCYVLMLFFIFNFFVFFFNDTATTEIYTLSLHDALPIRVADGTYNSPSASVTDTGGRIVIAGQHVRSEEHTSELQSLAYLVCRLLLEKKKKKIQRTNKHQSKKKKQQRKR